MLADGVVHHRFDHREGHAFAAEIGERVFDQLAAEAAAAREFVHGEIGDAAFARIAVEARGDPAEDGAVFLGDENAHWIGLAVFIDVAGFAPAPVAAAEHAELFLDVLINGKALESLDGEAAKFGQIGGLEAADVHEQKCASLV